MKATSISLLAFCLSAIAATASAQKSAAPDSWMCTPGELIFAEDFDPETDFKTMESRVHKASRAEDDYVLSPKPELARLKEDGIAKQRYTSELAQVRVQLEAAGDKQLAALIAETARRQTELEARYPEPSKAWMPPS